MFTASHLTRLKIALRKQEATLKADGHVFRKRAVGMNINEIIQGVVPRGANNSGNNSAVAGAGAAVGASAGKAQEQEGANGAVGKNEGTVRFLFGPDQD